MTVSKAINNVQVSERTAFGKNATISKEVLYQFYVKNQGPFTLTYEAGQDAPDTVAAQMNAQVQKLVDLSIITAAEAGI